MAFSSQMQVSKKKKKKKKDDNNFVVISNNFHFYRLAQGWAEMFFNIFLFYLEVFLLVSTILVAISPTFLLTQILSNWTDP